MKESKQWRDFLCILKFSRTGNLSVNARSIKKSYPFDCKFHEGQVESSLSICLKTPAENLALSIPLVLIALQDKGKKGDLHVKWV